MKIGKVEMTGGFFLLFAWLNYMDRQFIVPLAVAGCLMHELGHYFMIRAVGGDVKMVRLTAIGAEMAVRRPLGYWQEGISALAGPGVNLVLAVIFCTWEWGRTFAGINLVMAVFNLIPIGRLDGGRALYCTLALLAGPDWAVRVGCWLDVTCTAILVGIGFFLVGAGGNITLLLVAVWLAAAVLKQNHNKLSRKGLVSRIKVR